MNEEMSQKLSHDCAKKSKLAAALKHSLENCQNLKKENHKKLLLEERLRSKTDSLKQQNKQLMHKLATLKKRLEGKTCDDESSLTF